MWTVRTGHWTLDSCQTTRLCLQKCAGIGWCRDPRREGAARVRPLSINYAVLCICRPEVMCILYSVSRCIIKLRAILSMQGCVNDVSVSLSIDISATLKCMIMGIVVGWAYSAHAGAKGSLMNFIPSPEAETLF